MSDPTQVGDFVVLGRLGAGGMGQVYLGRSPGGRLVAVKVLHEVLVRAESGFRERFRREAAAASAVSGAFTAPVVAFDAEAPLPWLATAYVPGPTLAEVVSGSGPLAAPAVLSLAAGLAEALAAVHAAGVVHRDLKPANVILAEDGLRVIDFGIARDLDAALSQGVTLSGTPGYIAPEYVTGQAPAPAGDVFALGVVLHYATTGQGPFGAESGPVLLSRVVHDEPDLSGITDPGLAGLIAACLAKDPASRPTPAQVITDWAATAVGHPILPADHPRRTPSTTPPPATSASPGAAEAQPVPPPKKPRRGRLVAALLTGALLVLAGGIGVVRYTGQNTAGGATPDGSSAGAAATRDITITLGTGEQPTSYNANTFAGSSYINLMVLNQVLGGFVSYAPDWTITENTDFGTYRKVSDNPLTVQYSINPKATWSDGVPVTCDDAVFTWLANGNRTGPQGFQSVDTSGYGLQDKPRCTSGSKDFTVVYRTPWADWQAHYMRTVVLPAHVAEKHLSLPTKIVDLADDPTSIALKPLIDFFNVGWDFTKEPLDPALIPSSGPYVLQPPVLGQPITLTANPTWWGTPPKARTIVIKQVPAEEQVAALRSGQIDLLLPADNLASEAAVLAQATPLNDLSVLATDSNRFAHLDFNFDTVFADKRLRQAFASCVPRQQIVDKLVRPINPRAQILQARLINPAQPAYGDLAAAGGGAQYDTVDLAKSKQLMAQAGKKTLTVRLGWQNDQTNLSMRVPETVAMIQASCAQAGITVVSSPAPNFLDKELPQGAWDAALYRWGTTPLAMTGMSLYQTRSADIGYQNFTGHSNPAVDALFNQLISQPDPGQQMTILKQIDVQLWNDLPTLPLFTVPTLAITDGSVDKVRLNTFLGPTWNAAEWDLR